MFTSKFNASLLTHEFVVCSPKSALSEVMSLPKINTNMPRSACSILYWMAINVAEPSLRPILS